MIVPNQKLKHIKTQNQQKRNSSRMLCFAIAILFLQATGVIAQCPPGPPQYDLKTQAVLTNPATSVATGQKLTVTVKLVNNGPCSIPKGEATAHVTLNAAILDLESPLNFRNTCGPGPWTYMGVISSEGQYNLFFRNNDGPVPIGATNCGLSFDLKARSATPSSKPSDITVVSGLHPTTTGYDGNINNQFAGTVLAVTGTRIPEPVKNIKAPTAVADFSIKADNCNAVLKWKTLPGSRVENFEVEYSATETNFIKVGVVLAATGPSFEFTHDQGNGRGYYRLKEIQPGGKFVYSKTINITTTCKVKKGF